ncbi:MAG: PCMD domain-containing protein [Bacteroidaceae bacterium]|nr:PCMD domain-containing protein [Bacteroidaceae bacterium]
MKKILVLLPLLAITMLTMAQTQYFYEWKNGSYTKRSVFEIDSITFAIQETPETPDSPEQDSKYFSMLYTFNGNYDLDKSRSYYEWKETDPHLLPLFQTGDAVWRNANPGFKLSMSSALADDYPTIASKGTGPDGTDCVRMQTKSTGSFGAMVGMPNASGSLFNGVFDVTNALKNFRLATKFGVPFRYLPVKLEADLRMENMGNVSDTEGTFMDEPDLYCVLYYNCGGTYMLNGNDVLSSDKIVAIARLKHDYDETNPKKDLPTMSPKHGVTSEWKHFELYLDYKPFDYSKEKPDTLIAEKAAEYIDMDKLANFGYSIVIGAFSSWQGAYFKANIGSTLYLDNLKLTCYNPYASGEGR